MEKSKDNYDKKNIIITGASRGLGLAILERLLNKNYISHCVCRSVTPELEHYLDSKKNPIGLNIGFKKYRFLILFFDLKNMI